MKIKKKIKKKSGSKTEILRNTEAQQKQLVSYKKKCTQPLFNMAEKCSNNRICISCFFRLLYV